MMNRSEHELNDEAGRTLRTAFYLAPFAVLAGSLAGALLVVIQICLLVMLMRQVAYYRTGRARLMVAPILIVIGGGMLDGWAASLALTILAVEVLAARIINHYLAHLTCLTLSRGEPLKRLPTTSEHLFGRLWFYLCLFLAGYTANTQLGAVLLMLALLMLVWQLLRVLLSPWVWSTLSLALRGFLTDEEFSLSHAVKFTPPGGDVLSRTRMLLLTVTISASLPAHFFADMVRQTVVVAGDAAAYGPTHLLTLVLADGALLLSPFFVVLWFVSAFLTPTLAPVRKVNFEQSAPERYQTLRATLDAGDKHSQMQMIVGFTE